MWVNQKQNLLQERWTHPITGESKIVSVKITHGRRAAEKKLREKLENISTSQHMRLSEVADKWLAEQELPAKYLQHEEGGSSTWGSMGGPVDSRIYQTMFARHRETAVSHE